MLRSAASGTLQYPGRTYGDYDADIDSAVNRANAYYAITPAINKLADKEQWFKEIERQKALGGEPGEAGPPPPESVKREYKKLQRIGRQTYDDKD
jgi:hypothetical protein